MPGRPAGGGTRRPTDVLDLIAHGTLEIEGQLVDSSNSAARAWVRQGEDQARVIYKPVRGERPLWDFPPGTLSRREVAAYVVSAAGGWDVVPPTVLREGPWGEGSVQFWIDASAPADSDPPDRLLTIVSREELAAGWIPVLEARLSDGSPVLVAHADRADLAAVAVFDLVVNNADRKGSHLLLDESGHLWGFDHGVSFHVEPKLRTVLWGWAGERLPAVDRERLQRLRSGLGDQGSDVVRDLSLLLSADEVGALQARVVTLLSRDRFPHPPEDGPTIPWPPW